VRVIDWSADRSRRTGGFRTARHIEIGALAYGATIEDLLDDIAERLSAWPREDLSKVNALDVSHPNTIQIATRAAGHHFSSLRPQRVAIAMRYGHS